MTRGRHRGYYHPTPSKRKKVLWAIVAVLLVIVGVLIYIYITPTPVEKAVNQLQFDASVSESEKQAIRNAIQQQSKTYDGSVTVSAQTLTEAADGNSVLAAYLPVTGVYATRQTFTKADAATLKLYVSGSVDDTAKQALAEALDVEVGDFAVLSSADDIPENGVAFMPANELTYKQKLLRFDGAYYLDSFTKGAIFRQASFSGSGAAGLNGLVLNPYGGKDKTLKVNMTGVTALTRTMMKKLNSVNDPKYFSKNIGVFLADADITHVSNEVSFKPNCPYSSALFCAPPEMIEVLKDSGVDAVELTGNHNNDTGNQYNTDSINLYHGLGWHTFGGGLNAVEAAKPFLADQKGSKVAFLGYNYADAPNSGAVATSSTAGANHFDADKVKADVAAAKQQGNFVIVDIQFWECYSYPNGYIEFPECDLPIANQKETFRQVADLGADMVIGTQAHQPQTYEIYEGTPIYYGLGNLYFEQTQWPGTERGIILTHYFVDGTLVQTKLSPTVYHSELQTRVLEDADAVKLLQRLHSARDRAGL
ncbi:MAG TPA: CapA family protein [Candidatus Saccharimonadales bacterium]|nr:CapA family protein [Candidatus Saccharimonadales bacterium]